jgi:membrane-associated phospholipid phosphatase
MVMRTRPAHFVTAIITLFVLSSSKEAAATDPDRVEWSRDWPRVRLVEGLDVIALTLASYEIDAQWQPPRRAHWHGGILFDDGIRNALRGRSYGAQETATQVSDMLYKGGVLAPYIIDVYVVALGVHQSADVAVQMLLINMQSLGIAGVMSLTAEHSVGRTRPYVQDCDPDGIVRDASGKPLFNSCGPRDFQSFFSGHATGTATMAGLTCVHHQHLPLYGGGLADLAPCVLMIGVSLTTGISRIVGDHHWASDVIMGWGVGALSGYVLPSVLHYGFSSGRPIGEMRVGGVRVIPVPQATLGGAGFALFGTY